MLSTVWKITHAGIYILYGVINRSGGGRATAGEQTNDGERASERATAGERRWRLKTARATAAAAGERRRASDGE